jgi:hypothetical protein
MTTNKPAAGMGLKVKTSLKAGQGVVPQGSLTSNHNQSLVRAQPKPAFKVKTSLKAGSLTTNHNHTQIRPLPIKSGLKRRRHGE